MGTVGFNTRGQFMSATVHMIIGGITLILFLVNAVMYGIEFVKGKPAAYHRLVSIAAATGLLLQYMLGFMLLADSGFDSISWTHWVIALLAILPVGLEHGGTANQTNFRKKSIMGLSATTITIVLVFVVFMIGELN